MKGFTSLFRLRYLPVLLFCTSLLSCSDTNSIDDYFTFNLQKSFGLNASAGSTVWPPMTVTVPVSIDSSDLARNGTTSSLVRTVKLTRLVFASTDVAYPFSNIDTLILTASDSSGTQLVATYSGAVDSMGLTNADIASYLKNPKATFSATFGYQKPPPAAVTFNANYTLVVTARPQQ
ncbi:MAG: hypothetical protein Q8916_00905 [Bacteroidota bacterium]|nr:hypothetical protein [Bacteroidota bacterium]MDP4228945.1 hypothetical protein [Bacteroidota bacterium]MDP4235972.1 hypothetical protein [Bacteroidota bacterium]